MEIIVLEWPTEVKKKQENKIQSEDYAVWNDEHGYYIVADGVSRDVYERKGESIAREAAKRACETMAVRLSTYADGTIQEAFKFANKAVKELNEEQGLWGKGNNNYLDRDLAGACLACLVKKNRKFYYGYIGDCRVAHLSSDEKLDIVPDQVLEAQIEFPKQGAIVERVITIRRERRNNPSTPHKTYGVLTGEDAALYPKYLKFGSYECRPGDVVLVCSDGVGSFVENDKVFSQLLLTGTREKIWEYVADPTSPYHNADEKTLILCRV
ncbi:hypothetical protein BH09PAT2_BH09PAT2_04630 [soil metagenome]